MRTASRDPRLGPKNFPSKPSPAYFHCLSVFVCVFVSVLFCVLSNCFVCFVCVVACVLHVFICSLFTLSLTLTPIPDPNPSLNPDPNPNPGPNPSQVGLSRAEKKQRRMERKV